MYHGFGTFTKANGRTVAGTLIVGRSYSVSERARLPHRSHLAAVDAQVLTCCLSVGDASSQGTWNMGKKEGNGSFNNGDGSVYQGGFAQDQYHGKGVMRYANGDVFDGDWECGACQPACSRQPVSLFN